MAAALAFIPAAVVAQVPTSCLQIEQVLVDACNSACPGGAEGQNEMFRFVVGPDPIALNDLEASWATLNPFLGWVQNGLTADLTAQLNATITNCGRLLEPTNGSLPAGSRVLGITSTDLCVAGNSFAALGDTLYVIYQNAGNTPGHFRNNNNGNVVSNTPSGANELRQFRLNVISQQCSDTVEYNLRLLVNQYGTYGGTPAENDGSSLVLDWVNQPGLSYVNAGCQAPFTPPGVAITADMDTVPCGGTVALAGTTTANVVSILWSGGTGSFSDPASLNTTYTPGVGEAGPLTLSLCVVNTCGIEVCDELALGVGSGLDPVITPDGPTNFCAGSSIQLTASGGGDLLWSTGETQQVITVTDGGTVSVTSTNACGTATATIDLVVVQPPVAGISGPSSLCEGEEGLVIASGGGEVTWDNGSTNDTLQVNGPGTYQVTVTNACGSDQASIGIGPGIPLDPQFNVDNLEGCAPHCAVFTATGALDAQLVWDFGTSGSSEGVVAAACFEAGVHDVVLVARPLPGDTRCGAALSIPGLIRAWPVPVASFTTEPPVVSMDDPNVRFTSTSIAADSLSWWIETPEGFRSEEPAFPFRFPSAWCYSVTLEARTGQGCSDQANDTICVEEPFAIWVPNSFSPDNDGINDVLNVVSSVAEPEQYELLIHDRWGRPMHRSTSIGTGWSGANAPVGVYAWQLELTDRQGRKHDRRGHVTLVR